MNPDELKDFLDQKVIQYNTPDFIDSDPIQIPHLFSQKEDIEIDKGEVQIWFESDDFGNRYVSFPVEWIKELLDNEKTL